MTDMPLDERRFHGVLHDVAASSQAGAIRPQGLSAWHSFGQAECDREAPDLEVRVFRRADAPPAALQELDAFGFRTISALEFWAPADERARLEAWAVVTLYAEQLYGWVLTRQLDFEDSGAFRGREDSLVQVTLEGRHTGKAVLVSADRLVQSTS